MKKNFKLFYLLVLCFCAGNVQAQKLQIMSYNIHHGADKNEVNTLDSIGYFIKQMQPDIVGLQEVDSICERSGRADQMKRLGDITGMHYTFVRHFPYQGGAYGLGVLSKYPILHTENKRLQLLKKGPNGQSVALLFATLKISNRKKILFVTAHFDAFDKATRESQANVTVQYLTGRKMPVIFAGDLNATPEAEEIQFLKQYLQDTDPNGVPTFPDAGPGKKIDYILVNPKALRCVESVAVPDVHYSDHLPLISRIVLK